MKHVVIYHKDCQDGFGAAFILREWLLFSRNIPYDDIITIPGEYGKPLPKEVEDAIVYLADFSYKMFTMQLLLDKAASVTLLDHHKTAIDELILAPNNIVAELKFDCSHCTNEKSGTLIAWEYCYPDKEPPDWVKFISDKDLWQFRYENTKAFSAWLFTIPYDFAEWGVNLRLFTTYDHIREKVLAIGNALLVKQAANVQAMLAHKHFILINEYYMPAVCAPYMYASDIGDYISTRYEEPSAIYFIKANGKVQFSLRSPKDGIDVSAIASAFGGGGHRSAAGFTCTIQELTEMIEKGLEIQNG